MTQRALAPATVIRDVAEQLGERERVGGLTNLQALTHLSRVAAVEHVHEADVLGMARKLAVEVLGGTVVIVPSPTPSEVDTMIVSELKAHLSERSLVVSGTKAILAARLKARLEFESGGTGAGPASPDVTVTGVVSAALQALSPSPSPSPAKNKRGRGGEDEDEDEDGGTAAPKRAKSDGVAANPSVASVLYGVKRQITGSAPCTCAQLKNEGQATELCNAGVHQCLCSGEQGDGGVCRFEGNHHCCCLTKPDACKVRALEQRIGLQVIALRSLPCVHSP